MSDGKGLEALLSPLVFLRGTVHRRSAGDGRLSIPADGRTSWMGISPFADINDDHLRQKQLSGLWAVNSKV